MAEQFHIWSGNVKVIVDNPTKIPENMETDKFNTCRHRSEEQDITVQSCCSSYVRRGIVCLKRNINFLGPSVCVPCPQYEAKDSQTQEGQQAP